MSTESLPQPAPKANNQLGFIALVRRSRPINLITGPIIYSMVIPLVLLDICVSFYQATCFPVYKIGKVSRGDYIIFDRQEIKYLDWISKFHCTYCAYGVGVLAYVSAIIGRTEAYFCPIKHHNKAHLAAQTLVRYLDFDESADFDYEKKLEKIRQRLAPKQSE
ncbi:MAG: hypothetical protein WCK81_08105 [Betaproteobacteria bacterium]